MPFGAADSDIDIGAAVQMGEPETVAAPAGDIDRKVLRAIIGTPPIAITMLRHDVTAGLFAPVEVLLVDEGDGASALTYVKPSSLMVVDDNPKLLSAAEELDARLAALVAKATSG